MPAGDITEKSSQSNYQVARVRALAIDYDVDFDSKVLRGKCTYDVDILADNVTEVVLDTKDIEILGAKAAGEFACCVAPHRCTFHPYFNLLCRRKRTVRARICCRAVRTSSKDSHYLFW